MTLSKYRGIIPPPNYLGGAIPLCPPKFPHLLQSYTLTSFADSYQSITSVTNGNDFNQRSH